MPSNTLLYYMNQVQRRAGQPVSSSFPTSATDSEQMVLDSINERLRYLNSKYCLLFKATTYALTTTAGQASYNLANSPYSQTYWNVSRMARNGVIRVSDDWPLHYVDYTELDSLKPNTTGSGRPNLYSSYGGNLLIYPSSEASALTIRYYGNHIGTDTTGVTQKLRLSVSTDLTMLDDQWEDCLVTGAAMKVREWMVIDEKYQALLRAWEEWETILNDMGNQPGEDAPPQFKVGNYLYGDGIDTARYYPFFTPYSGGA